MHGFITIHKMRGKKKKKTLLVCPASHLFAKVNTHDVDWYTGNFFIVVL